MTTELATTEHPRELPTIDATAIATTMATLKTIRQFVASELRDGTDYGTIPGTNTKKVMLLPGAQKVCMLYNCYPRYEVKTMELGDGHVEFQVVTELVNRSTETVVGSGIGSCSTMEGKYRYRGGSRLCPQCQKATIKKSKYPPRNDPNGQPGFYCYGKIGGCGAEFAANDKSITSQSEERQENPDIYDCRNCVTPDTKILTHDLRWVAAGDIETGDRLIGVAEDVTDRYGRNLAIGEATVDGTREDQVYKLTFHDGRTVRCNGEHQWLVKKVGLKGTEWVSTEAIYREVVERSGRPRHWHVMSFCKPWEHEQNWVSGYAAGLLDADGTLNMQQLRVQFAQQDNTTMARMQALLGSRDFATSMTACKSEAALALTISQKQVYNLSVQGGIGEQLRLLGTFRPPRLMEKFMTYDLPKRRLEGSGSGNRAGSPARLIEIIPDGTDEIVLLGTSCGTYIAEGLVCHNTVLKMAKKRSCVDASIGLGCLTELFTQDLDENVPDAPEPHPPERDRGNAKDAELASATKEWADALATMPTLNSFNGMLPDLKPLPEVVRKRVWALFQAHAEHRGWEWDREAVCFNVKQTVPDSNDDEPIPF